MLQRQQTDFSLTISCNFVSEEILCEAALFSTELRLAGRVPALAEFILSAEDDTESEDADSGLEDAARNERDYLRQRLREELGREPTEQELDEWLRRHTEGY